MSANCILFKLWWLLYSGLFVVFFSKYFTEKKHDHDDDALIEKWWLGITKSESKCDSDDHYDDDHNLSH